MVIPKKLQKGDEIRIIAPANSLALISQENITLATKALEEQGFIVTFSQNVHESDMFTSSSIQSRIDDLHSAFLDKNVTAILCVIGGHNSNQLLDYIDYTLIKNNPKIFCGYSDITALQNAIYAKTQLVTYSGLCYSSFAMQKENAYNIESFLNCLTQDSTYSITPSTTYSDDTWYIDQNDRTLISNEGFWVIQEGTAQGKILGANLCTFNLLQGTQYMPDLSDSILFLEDDYETNAVTFDRDLQSLIQQPNFNKVTAIVIGRFQLASEMTREKIHYIVSTKKELKNIPIIANVDFGHTNPLATFPIGGEVKIESYENKSTITILKH